MSNPTSKTMTDLLNRTGKEIALEPLAERHAESLFEFKARNRAFLQPFSPILPEAAYGREHQQHLVRQAAEEAAVDQAYRFAIVHRESGALIGQLNLTGIIRGVFQNVLLGYSLDERHNGKGYMTEAVELALDIAFGPLRLHRMQAGVMPRNTGSIRVLQKNGFTEEGYARNYVRINGKWEDHVLFAKVNDDWEE